MVFAQSNRDGPPVYLCCVNERSDGDSNLLAGVATFEDSPIQHILDIVSINPHLARKTVEHHSQFAGLKVFEKWTKSCRRRL